MLEKSRSFYNRLAACVPMMASVVTVALLTACGGGGGGGGSTPAPAAPAKPSSRIFMADATSMGVASAVEGNPAVGIGTVDRFITGSNTGFTGDLNGLAIDATADRLFVTQGSSILVFDNGGLAHGNVAPSRVLAQGGSGVYRSPFIDTANDRLYVSDSGNSVLVFNQASSASLATPARTITGNFGASAVVHSVAVDTIRNQLYVLIVSSATVGATTYPSYARVAVFNNAATISGTVVPDRYINIGAHTNAGSVVIDPANDRLYVSMLGQILVYDNASSVSGTVTASRTITLPGGGTPLVRAAVDFANNRLYAVVPYGLFIIENASTASGAVTAGLILVSGGGTLTAVAVK